MGVSVGWLYDELIKQAGPDSEDEVRSAAKRWRERSEPILRDLTALRLANDQDRATISIHAVRGLPEPLKNLDRKPAEAGQALLGIYLPVFEKFLESGDTIGLLLESLFSLKVFNVDELFDRKNALDPAVVMVGRLRTQAKKSPFLPTLFQYDEDILGTYFYSIGDQRKGDIVLYWGVIGAVAKQLGCSVEMLTAVTLIHELAHAYTHLGADIEGHRWDSAGFADSSKAVKEGLAQYYTYLAAMRFRDRNEHGIIDAYGKLLEFLPSIYWTHLEWVEENFSPEMVRLATLQARLTRKGIDKAIFQELLAKAHDRLSGNSPTQARFFPADQ